MDMHIAAEPGTADEIPAPEAQPATELLPPPPAEVSDEDFGEVVRGALEAVGGALLFKVRVGAGETDMHVAAAAVGAPEARQFLLLSLPIHGGQLKVETAQRSTNPLAGIAASWAGLMDAFQAAA
jgi:hypothetical protein